MGCCSSVAGDMTSLRESASFQSLERACGNACTAGSRRLGPSKGTSASELEETQKRFPARESALLLC